MVTKTIVEATKCYFKWIHIDFSFSSNFENLIASGKLDIGVWKNFIEKVHNVSFIY